MGSLTILQIVALVLCSACIILNVCSFVILGTTKKLQKSRFKSLVIFLSVSDFVTGTEFLTHVLLDVNNDGQINLLYGCMILKHLIAGTITFSLYQTMLICLERLNATFKQRSNLILKMTTKKAILISFVTIHGYTFIHLGYRLQEGVTPCHVADTAVLSFVLILDIPIMLLLLAIVMLYALVIFRLFSHSKKIFDMVETATVQMKNSKRLMRRNINTLGSVIIVTMIANLPRTILAFYSLYSGPTVKTLTWLKISNHLLLLNLIFDPIINVLRIREYRDRIICCKKTSLVSSETVIIDVSTIQTTP